VAAVVGLGAMRGAAVAAKASRIGIGKKAEIFDVPDAGALQPRRDIAAEIEQRVAVAGGGRKFFRRSGERSIFCR